MGRVGGGMTPPFSPLCVAFDFSLSCFFVFVKFCVFVWMCKVVFVVVLRDLRHMVLVTNIFYAACPYSRSKVNLT